MKSATLLVLSAFLCAAPAFAQDEARLAARCSKLADLAEDSARICSGMGCNDSMIVTAARLDCEKGKYAQAIAALEKYLREQRVTVPPE